MAKKTLSKGFPQVPLNVGLPIPLVRFLQSVRDSLLEAQILIRFISALSGDQQKALLAALKGLSSQASLTTSQADRLNAAESTLNEQAQLITELASIASVTANTELIEDQGVTIQQLNDDITQLREQVEALHEQIP